MSMSRICHKERADRVSIVYSKVWDTHKKHTLGHLFLHNNALLNPNDQIIKPKAKPEKHFHSSSHFLSLS
jgi:hypothetical protein